MDVRGLGKTVLVAVVVALGGCSAADGVSSDSEALHKGAGDGPPVWKTDPCEGAHTSPGVKQYQKDGVNYFIGTDGDDVIVGTKGRDIIWGNAGNDVICAGEGDDEVHGGAGHDYIDGGAGNDVLYGGDGNDIIHGRAGSDEIHGGDGDDILMGDLLDDKIWGDDGNDLLIGGHGNDELHGGKGNDYLRGDTGNDTFDGGEGEDVVSFVTAMPPGDGDSVHSTYANGIDGMVVDFTDPCVDPAAPGVKHDGCAYGDGNGEPLDGIEVVVGSPYNDHFVSGGNQKFVGGFGDDKFSVPHKSQIVDGAGNDVWNGQPIGKPGGGPAPGNVWVYVEGHERDLGVVVIGSPNADHLTIGAMASHQLEVKGSNGTHVDTNDSCHQVDASTVRCDIPHTLRWVAAYGADGNDTITLQGHFPRDFTAHVSGGRDDDVITGGDEQDVLFTGITGSDILYGGDGDDALLSQSRPKFNKDKLTQVVPYTDGADKLFGGDGNDQLVADFPCGGHEFSGGKGIDIAGFARSGALPIHAQLAQQDDNPSIKMPFYAHAYNPQINGSPGTYCTVGQGTLLHPDLEILEGGSGDDVLYGNDEDNIIWGRDGNDEIHGLGGDDHLFGLKGNDHIYGEAGSDVLEGGAGFDFLYGGGDNTRDILLCGPDGGRVMTSDSHDEVTGCKYQ
jgi:Ca2+-binding RTX toxin-like protein